MFASRNATPILLFFGSSYIENVRDSTRIDLRNGESGYVSREIKKDGENYRTSGKSRIRFRIRVDLLLEI